MVLLQFELCPPIHAPSITSYSSQPVSLGIINILCPVSRLVSRRGAVIRPSKSLYRAPIRYDLAGQGHYRISIRYRGSPRPALQGQVKNSLQEVGPNEAART